jgi:hypothetical protein
VKVVEPQTWKLALPKKMEKKNYYAINVDRPTEHMVIDGNLFKK